MSLAPPPKPGRHRNEVQSHSTGAGREGFHTWHFKQRQEEPRAEITSDPVRMQLWGLGRGWSRQLPRVLSQARLSFHPVLGVMGPQE